MEKVMFVLMAMVTVGAVNLGTLPSSEECGLPGHPIVSSFLQALGFSQSCVATVLDACFPSRDGQLSSLIKEVREMTQVISQTIEKAATRPRHCKDLMVSGDSGSGVRFVYPYPGQPHHRVAVFCDHTVDGGGWTVFQRRTDAATREDFYRTWTEYQLGFGSLEGEFWLGLDHLQQLTSVSLQELRVELADYEGGERWAKYGMFHVGPMESNYRLSVGRYSGDAGDGFDDKVHNGMQFSTHDSDHDTSDNNCAEEYRGGWWYKSCHISNLNGYQHVGNHTTFADGINWKKWRGYHYSLRRTAMMLRPAL